MRLADDGLVITAGNSADHHRPDAQPGFAVDQRPAYGDRAADADGDPVSLSYVWLKNGMVIPGQTGSTLDD